MRRLGQGPGRRPQPQPAKAPGSNDLSHPPARVQPHGKRHRSPNAPGLNGRTPRREDRNRQVGENRPGGGRFQARKVLNGQDTPRGSLPFAREPAFPPKADVSPRVAHCPLAILGRQIPSLAPPPCAVPLGWMPRWPLGSIRTIVEEVDYAVWGNRHWKTAPSLEGSVSNVPP